MTVKKLAIQNDDGEPDAFVTILILGFALVAGAIGGMMLSDIIGQQLGTNLSNGWTLLLQVAVGVTVYIAHYRAAKPKPLPGSRPKPPTLHII